MNDLGKYDISRLITELTEDRQRIISDARKVELDEIGIILMPDNRISKATEEARKDEAARELAKALSDFAKPAIDYQISMDTVLSTFRLKYPSDVWAYGFQSPDWTGKALAYLNNRTPSHIGFDNLPNKDHRSYCSVAPTIEEAAALVLRQAAEDPRNVT